MNINYKSDFDCILTVKDCHENDIGFPTFDFEAKFYTRNFSAYRVSSMNGVLTNCFNDNGKIHCVFQNHKLGPGKLMVEFHSIIPDDIYTDGMKDIYSPQDIGVSLISGKGDCADELEMQVTPNIVVINTGEGGGGQLPDEWPELKQQIETALADMTSLEGTVSENETTRGTNEQQRETDEATRRENEKLRTDTEELRQTNEGKRIEAESNRISSEETRVRSESTRKSSEGTRVEAEDERVEAEGIRMQNEEARIKAERSRAEAETTRAETFATYAPKIDAKMNKFDVGAGLQLEGGVLSVTGGGSGGGGTGEVVSFRKMWIAAGGTYNEQTGLYGLNGIDDIDEEEAMNIWRSSVIHAQQT